MSRDLHFACSLRRTWCRYAMVLLPLSALAAAAWVLWFQLWIPTLRQAAPPLTWPARPRLAGGASKDRSASLVNIRPFGAPGVSSTSRQVFCSATGWVSCSATGWVSCSATGWVSCSVSCVSPYPRQKGSAENQSSTQKAG